VDARERLALGRVGDVAPEPGHGTGLGLPGAVDALVGIDQLDEPVALDRQFPG
jgi:hypothetical protein